MFNATAIFQDIVSKGVRSVILTSGTLTPMSQYERELGLTFAHKLTNSHVIP